MPTRDSSGDRVQANRPREIYDRRCDKLKNSLPAAHGKNRRAELLDGEREIRRHWPAKQPEAARMFPERATLEGQTLDGSDANVKRAAISEHPKYFRGTACAWRFRIAIMPLP